MFQKNTWLIIPICKFTLNALSLACQGSMLTVIPTMTRVLNFIKVRSFFVSLDLNGTSKKLRISLSSETLKRLSLLIPHIAYEHTVFNRFLHVELPLDCFFPRETSFNGSSCCLRGISLATSSIAAL